MVHFISDQVADPVLPLLCYLTAKYLEKLKKSENSENLDASSMSGNYHIYLSEEG